MVKYEDELDLLAIVEVSHTEDEGRASVHLHHNKSGALLKKIALQEPWDVVGITQYSYSPLWKHTAFTKGGERYLISSLSYYLIITRKDLNSKIKNLGPGSLYRWCLR